MRGQRRNDPAAAIDPAVALNVENISKIYGEQTATGLLGIFKVGGRSDKRRVVALKDVTAAFRRGRIHGVIGPSGSGKTTLLRIIGGVAPPTSGRVRGLGRVAALYGFGGMGDPSKSGRENIFIQARLMGWRDADIAPHVEAVIDFAELRQFADVSVSRYSKGMQMRLDFSIAVNLSPDILLLDDVLAVGDRAFQEKALERLGALAKDGACIIFVSNDMNHVTRLCDEASVLRGGVIERTGPPDEIAPQYLKSLLRTSHGDLGDHAQSPSGQILSVDILKPDGAQATLVTDHFDTIVEITYAPRIRFPRLRVGLALYSDGVRVFLSEEFFETPPTDGPVIFRTIIPSDHLSHRVYEMNVSVKPILDGSRNAGDDRTLKVTPAAVFKVLQGRGSGVSGGSRAGANPLFRIQFPWTIELAKGLAHVGEDRPRTSG